MPVLPQIDWLPTYTYTTKEVILNKNGQNIYSIVYTPDITNKKLPFVIFSHGLNGSYENHHSYAESLASHGIASICYDFLGGSTYSKSDGSMLEMSIMTEVNDLEFVLNEVKQWDFVDTTKIILIGSSQGGYVSAVGAARHPSDIAGVVMNFPPFCATSMLHDLFPTYDDISETFFLAGSTLGSRYAKDLYHYDVFSEIKNYKKKVLLLHGDVDHIAPIDFSYTANDVYNDCKFIIYHSDHGFRGEIGTKAIEEVYHYMKEIGIFEN